MPEIWNIYKEIWVSASHQLTGGGYEGKCKNLHGHNYKIKVYGTRTTLNEQQMVCNFDLIKQAVMPLDHAHLNNVMGTDLPTAEAIAKWIHGNLVKLTNNTVSFRVVVYETNTSYAEYWSG